MSRGIFAGMTDYSHQSLDDMLGDLRKDAKRAAESVADIERNIEVLQLADYWDSNVPGNFRMVVLYSVKHYRTVSAEINAILEEMKSGIRDHHCRRLRKIASVADSINCRIGVVWNSHYDRKDYGEPDFAIVERVYATTRNEAVDLLDVSNIAGRLEDFVGKGERTTRANNAWITGSFYLLAFLIVLLVLCVLVRLLGWFLLSVVMIATVLVIGTIGAFQLKNDDRLKDEHFVELMIETYKRLPLLRGGGREES